MKNRDLIELLEAEWDPDGGFLGKLRQGEFDETGYARLIGVLGDVQAALAGEAEINRRLVALVWYIPIFMAWQTERVAGKKRRDEYDKAVNETQARIQSILGVP